MRLKFLSILNLLFCVLMASGCSSVVVKKAPPIAHIHVGHTLTGWVTTPDKKGLISTAEQEAAIMMDNAQKAKAARSLADKKRYMGNALNALDPKLQPNGPGRGFGLTRALVESTAHIQYAATSPDASANIRQTVPVIVKKAQVLSSNSNQLKVFARAAMNASSTAEADALINEFLNTIAKSSSTYSVASFKKDIEVMASRESNPGYTTVDSYYLFNLIRLPNGAWGFANNAGSSDAA
ncbi:MAG: hypothetical protein R3E95_23465, partial [Thiolinea sp.]